MFLIDDLFNTVFNGITAGNNANNQNRNTTLQYDYYNMNRDNAQWQRSFSTEQFNEAVRQFDLNTYLNSIEGRVDSARRAGLNPLAVLGMGNSSQAVSPSMSPAASLPSASFSPVPASPFSPTAPTNIESLARAYESLTKGGLNTAQENSLAEKLPHEIESLILGNEGQAIMNTLNDIEVYVKQNVKDTRVKQATQDYLNSMAMYWLYIQQEDESKARESYYNAAGALAVIEEQSKDAQLKLFLEYGEKQIKAFIRNLEARTSAAYATANYNNALAMTENDIREFKVANEKWLSKLSHYEVMYQDKIQQQRYETYLSELEAKKLLPKEIQEDIRQKIKNNDWFEVRQIQSIFNDVVNAYESVKGVSADMMRNKISERYMDYKYNYTHKKTIQKDHNTGVVEVKSYTDPW